MNWLDDDLASRTVADRVAMYREVPRRRGVRTTTASSTTASGGSSTRDGDGKADAATVFADGFNDPAAGLGAGVLARGGDVWYTCIPDLWQLRDTDGDGKADEPRVAPRTATASTSASSATTCTG